MAIVLRSRKQPAEVLDFDIDFSDRLAEMSDTGASHVVTAETGITVDSSSLASGVVKFWLSGGTSGQRYKITVRVTTTGGRLIEAEAVIRVRED